MKNYELPISPNYVSNWGIKEAIREILQNAIDADNLGYKKNISYDKDNQKLIITNFGTKLPMSSLVLGCSSKSDIEGQIGKFGEGYKLALVVLLRKGMNINILNFDEYWVPSFKMSEQFDTQVLNIQVSPLSDSEQEGTSLTFVINGISKDLFDTLKEYFPCIDDDYGNMVECDNGTILLDNKFKGKMFVEGLYIQSDTNFEYGYNFKSSVVDLDRDRKAINYYELRKLTAASVITAEKCSPEIFKAISKSCTDVRDIEDVLDDASEDFLIEYRDMLYKEKDLEENTLIATESVMKQLQQMDVDVPIVKGTEIESYLVAKANDRLGLIYQAKEAVSKRTNEEDAWDSVKSSRWFKLKCWMETYGKRISKEGKEEFERILYYFEPSDYDYVKKYIPEDFVWTVENFRELENNQKTEL